MEPTDKQISFAKNLGIENPQNYTKAALREMIDKKLAEKPQKQEVKKEPRREAPTSYYVAYAKDICVALINAGSDKPIPCMKTAIDMIKMARAELQ